METSVEDGENKTIGEDCFNLLPVLINLSCLQSPREIAGQGQRKVVILLQVEKLPMKHIVTHPSYVEHMPYHHHDYSQRVVVF